MDYKAFFKLTYGLYIISSKDGEKLNGHISNTVFQVTAEPPRIAIATHQKNLTTEFIRKSGAFAISVLQQDVNLEFVGPWGFKSGREVDKFKNTSFITRKTGAPIVLDKTIAWYDCEVEEIHEIGTHVIFIGKVVDAEVTDDTSKPLTYDHYRNNIKGVSPANSPTYIEKDKLAAYKTEEIKPKTETPAPKADGKDWRKYRCIVCGHVYDPTEGDIPAGIKPGTAFEDIPENWTCPICGVTKEDFVAVD
jgi:flavin reductase (DIM6/NTAB) family NADH-FMN oxidoreductase RutF/rubredoxin